ncbi:MAG: ABC transporter ATP-binding protein, partial [Lachnospiraceae bacterium]|nr:ABC transporter ATP-binding protein [Lachnospiraceae bacterium]
MITLEKIHFRYAGAADAGGLSDVSLTIPDGQVVLLCGPSGCGKTTVTRLINGLIPHFYEGELTGEVYVNGEAVSRLPLYQTARMVGSVFQNPRTQFFTVDSTSEMAFGCENQGLAEEVIKERILSTADRFGLQGLLGKSIFEMSGGEKQKVACASVAVSDPPVIVLDEPSSNLDVSATMELRRMLSVWKKQGKTILIAEHRLYYLIGLLDRIVYMKEGRICAEYTEREMRKMPVREQIKMGLRPFELSKFPVKHRREVAGESIVLSDFTFSYRKKEALVKIDRLTLPKGAVVALIGHNGAGKSTLARCLCGLEKGAGGRLDIGQKTYGRRKRLKSCYMVMQDVNHQLFTESVYEETAISMARPDEEEIS